MTGTRDPETIRKLEALGYQVGGLTKDCIVVIVPTMDFHSAKTEKASQLGISIIPLDKVDDLIQTLKS